MVEFGNKISKIMYGENLEVIKIYHKGKFIYPILDIDTSKLEYDRVFMTINNASSQYGETSGFMNIKLKNRLGVLMDCGEDSTEDTELGRSGHAVYKFDIMDGILNWKSSVDRWQNTSWGVHLALRSTSKAGSSQLSKSSPFPHYYEFVLDQFLTAYVLGIQVEFKQQYAKCFDIDFWLGYESERPVGNGGTTEMDKIKALPSYKNVTFAEDAADFTYYYDFGVENL